MTIWALADLHLAFGAPSKKMDVFGPRWTNYSDKIKKHWEASVAADDLVLLAGDISWALKLDDAMVDFNWIHQLPGTKVMIRGNHDYWWESPTKMRQRLPPSIHLIQNSSFTWEDVAIAGSRLWDTEEYGFGPYIDYKPKEGAALLHEPASEEHLLEEQRKIFERELGRLELSLKAMDPKTKTRIAMTHYPPIGADLKPSRASTLLEKYGINTCVFGHLHSVKEAALPFGQARGVTYVFTAGDYIDFKPVKLL